TAHHSTFSLPAPPATYTLSLHDALPIFQEALGAAPGTGQVIQGRSGEKLLRNAPEGGLLPDVQVQVMAQHLPAGGLFQKLLKLRSEEHTSELQSRFDLVCRLLLEKNNSG